MTTERLMSLSQRDVRNLLRYFAEPAAQTTSLLQAQELGLVIRSGHHPAVLAEKRIISLVRATRPDPAFDEAWAVLREIGEPAHQYLEAVFEPQPETVAYTRREAGLDYQASATTAKGRLTVTEPHDPYFEAHEAALLRFTPTLRKRAVARLEKARAEEVYAACVAAGADTWETATTVEEMVGALRIRSDSRGNPVAQHAVDQAVDAILTRALELARTPFADTQARAQAREGLATAKREAAELYATAADAYAQARARLFPPRRGPRSAPRPVQIGTSILDPRAWQDAAAE